MTDLDALRALPRFKAFESRVNANARPCDNDPLFHAFDFWIGEWDVQPTGTDARADRIRARPASSKRSSTAV